MPTVAMNMAVLYSKSRIVSALFLLYLLIRAEIFAKSTKKKRSVKKIVYFCYLKSLLDSIL